LKSNLVEKKLLYKSVRVYIGVQKQSFAKIESKLTVNNLTKPHVSGYKLFSKRTSTEISKDFRFQIKSRISLKI